MSNYNKLVKMKAEIMSDGLVIDDSVRGALTADGSPISLNDYASTSGVILKAEGDSFINAPVADFNDNFVTKPNWRLCSGGDDLCLTGPSGDFATEFVPVPSYHERTLNNGTPVTNIAVSHADRLRLSPTNGCTFKCQFCDIPYETKYNGVKSLEAIAEATAIALADTALKAEHILISGGVPPRCDFGAEMAVYEKVITENPDLDVDIMMAPIPELLDLEKLKEIGVHGLSINMELWNTELSKKIMPSKLHLEREQYLNFIEKAAALFGRSAVRSSLLVGLESMDDTLKGVRALAERGADPMLSPFRPSPVTPLANIKPPTANELVETYYRAAEIVSHFNGVELGPRCIPCGHNTMVIPDDSGTYYYSKRRDAGNDR
jgi:pyruvate-formate lyase-activating enzyme